MPNLSQNQNKPPGQSSQLAVFQLLMGALLFSTGGALIKLCSLDALQVAGFRSLIAAVTLFIFLPQARSIMNKKVWIAAIPYAATMILFVMGNKLTTAANTIFLQSTAPLYLIIFAPLILKEKPRASDFFYLVLFALGLGMILMDHTASTEVAPNPALGNIFAIIAGLTWAGTLMALRYLGKTKVDPIAAVVCGNIITALVCIPMSPLTVLPDGQSIGILFLLGIFQIGLAYYFVTRGVKRISALTTSLVLMVEPILNPVWAWVILSESPGQWSILAGAIILGAAAVKEIRALKGS